MKSNVLCRSLLLAFVSLVVVQPVHAGVLFAVTGNGAVPETMYTLNQTNGVSTFFQTLGNGSDGEVIAYNPNDGLMYHWSGGTVVFETINLNTGVVTNIPLSGSSVNEVFGATWDPSSGRFLAVDIASRYLAFSTTGVVTSLGNTLVSDTRGLAFVGSNLYTLEHFDGFDFDGVTDLLRIDPANGSVLSSINITSPGFTTNGRSFALTTNPEDGQLWGIVSIVSVEGRRLVTIDPTTGVATSIGLLSDKFSTLAFQSVPEPSSLLMLAAGITILGGFYLRRRVVALPK